MCNRLVIGRLPGLTLQGKTTRLGSWLSCFGVCADRERGCVPARMSELQITALGHPACSCRRCCGAALPALPLPCQGRGGWGGPTGLPELPQRKRGGTLLRVDPRARPIRRGGAEPCLAALGRAGGYRTAGVCRHSPGSRAPGFSQPRPGAPCSPPNPAHCLLPHVGAPSPVPTPRARLLFLPRGLRARLGWSRAGLTGLSCSSSPAAWVSWCRRQIPH